MKSVRVRWRLHLIVIAAITTAIFVLKDITIMKRERVVRSDNSLTIIDNPVSAMKTGEAKGDKANLCDVTYNSKETKPVLADKSEMAMTEVEKKYPEVNWGGTYSPKNCVPRHKVAIIVPYRNREKHLTLFLNHMHPFLMKQNIEYGIYVVEQQGNGPFNRAKLFNVGFLESSRLKSGWQCFVFHDVDLLPLDIRNIYSCPQQPRHMSASVDITGNKLMYEELFGGVSALTRQQFTDVNGFSNKFWGWGGEDDDMAYRVNKMKYKIERYPLEISKYTMLNHYKSHPNPERYFLLWLTDKNMFNDGLSSLQYKLVKVTERKLYTLIVVNIDESVIWRVASIVMFIAILIFVWFTLKLRL